MKKYILGFLLVLLCQIVSGQTYTQTYKYDYKLSKRFGFGASYKAAMSFGDSFSLLNNIQIGSKMIF